MIRPEIRKVPECDVLPEITEPEARKLAEWNLSIYAKFRTREDIFIKCLNMRGAEIDPNYIPQE